ncbi:hypothetical protein [Hymenobacter negativus]|uniref:Uncharacterized protein n=1 Tax=Hymenobacter negativus TaxID=2795026 RepID=A0ABS3QND5_9BACT|nr:hypothetical protein [Hymenobacter negativus]MBO2012294.1 hypothetical protein [Hymenobacter negativus]
MKTPSPSTWNLQLLLALLLAFTSTARAQDMPLMFDGLAGSLAMNDLLFATTTGRIARDKAGAATATAKSLAYVPSAALKQKTVQGYVDRLKTKNPAASQAVASTFGPGKYDYGKVYKGLIEGYNLRENDAVDAMTAYIVLGWMIVNNVQDDKAVTAAMVQGARAQVAPLLASNAKLAAPGVAAQVGEEMKLQSVIVQGGWQSAVKAGTLPAYRQGTASLFKTQYGLDLSQLKLTPQGFVAKNASTTASKPATSGTTSTTAVASTATPATASGSGLAAGAQWFFRAVSSGSGGISFEPVALLANGQYVDLGSDPLEAVNLTADKAKRPAAWGSWRKNGGTFVLTDYKGRPASYTLGSGSWFPAYPAGAVPLKRAYQNASGGSVGVATSLVISKIQFLDGTHFQEGKDAGIISSNAAGGSKRSGSGTYRLQGHTLTLTYADGRTVRKSFALGAAGTPAHPDSKLIFIGGDAYTDE